MAVPVATRRELLEAGVHFGHQTKKWNPKVKRFLYGERSGIYIIDLEKTMEGLQEAHDFLIKVGARNGTVLFVGTKKQAQEVVAEQASRVGMPYINTRWLGGMLTNFQTIYGRLKRLKELADMERSGAFDFLPKKEVLKLRHEKEKLERNLSGIQDMEKLPDAIFVIDTKKEHIAMTEARKLGIPIVAILDTNCDPDEIDYIIPGNDDAIRACTVIARIVADAVQEGQYMAYQRMQGKAAEPEFEREPAAAAAPAAGALTAAPTDEPVLKLSEEEAAWMGAAVDAPSAGDATPVAADEPTASTDTSSNWAEPLNPADLDAPTVPEIAGPADPEAIEAELDHVSEPGEPEPPPEPATGTPAPPGEETAPAAEEQREEGGVEEGEGAATPATPAAADTEHTSGGNDD
jgi:small subunit ribosomal protein S2